MTVAAATSDELRSLLLEFGTATLFEASKLRCALPHDIQAAWTGAAVVGRALPIETPAGDNLPLHIAIECAEAGDVLVVDGQGAPFGYWGEVMTVAAQARGVAGLVINGCVRDIAAIAALAFPVFATGRSVVGTIKGSRDGVGERIVLGSATVAPGDVIVADADGVVALPAHRLDAIVDAARARTDDEQRYMDRLRAGETTMDIYRLRHQG
jgi:4-hydroxy-4-methyl-2-oxoglutarate aldolase